MNIVQIVFSPTGGTQRVIDIITAEWGNSVNKIDLTNAKTDYNDPGLEKDDVAVIAVPSYGGRVPALAAQRLAGIHGNQARCIIVCVYGNRAYEDTLVELKDIAEHSNFRVVAAVSAIAEHSIMHQYATGRPDQQDENELHSFAGKIFEKINGSDAFCVSALQIPGNRPYKKGGAAVLVPKADKKCIGCGLCAEKCPAQAISRENIKTADSEKCISCMRCVEQCPKSARKVNGAMVSAVALAIKKACSERKSNELFI
ncbi:MAG: EFR1 family ferrodoxin [Eubacteriales bacterium]|nr:EFR1 family ferrodoxin [Eubacteriales bacterium]